MGPNIVAQPRDLTIGIDCRFVQDSYHGIGRYTYGLIGGLGAAGERLRVVAFVDPSLPNRRFAWEPLVRTGLVSIEPIAIPLYHPSELWRWLAALRKTPVDVFHTPYFWAPGWLPCPLVITVHDMIFDRFPRYMPRRHLALVYKLASRAALKRARGVIAVSEATKTDIMRYTPTPARKIAVVHEGVDPRFKPEPDDRRRREVRERYGLPAAYVLALGARRPHKNVERLIGAFADAARGFPHALVLVGTVDDRFASRPPAELARLKREGRLVELSHVAEQDLPVVYAMADLFVQPSIIEGFGLPVLEAMACGCPVACADASSLPEVTGDAALLFDPLSRQSIAVAIRRALGQPELRRELAARGARRVRSFTWESAARRTIDVYRAAASARREESLA